MNMETLIIYDNTGYIISQSQGQPTQREPLGVPFLWVEIPEGKSVIKIDTTVAPNMPVFADMPATAEDRISALEVAMAQQLGI
jgi:hypothetical protein